MFRQLARTFHSSSILASSAKSDLAKLRKKTGYTFSNCKKALEANDNDVVKAEQWLKQQAQALGWSKATKLEGRTTAQGLVGLALKNNTGVMLEINCETDFVARNKTFKHLVELATASCLQQLPLQKNSNRIVQATFTVDDLKSVQGPENKSLGDHAALAISSVGENIALRRALVVSVPNDVRIAGYTHPTPENHTAKVITGKYGAFVAYSANSDDSQTKQVAKQLCQHVVGMNPSKVGEVDVDEPAENTDDETVMIHQEFLLDPSTTVGHLVEGAGIKILGFWRFECGRPSQEQEQVEPSKASQAA